MKPLVFILKFTIVSKYWISCVLKMSSTTDEIMRELTDTLVEAFAGSGMNPTISRIYMGLFLAKKPQGLKEISEKTGYSVSTILGKMEVLDRFTDIRKFKQPGSKKIYYKCDHDIPSIMVKKIRNGKRLTQLMIDELKEAEEKLAKQKTPEAEDMMKKLVKMRRDYEDFNILTDKMLETYLDHLDKPK